VVLVLLSRSPGSVSSPGFAHWVLLFEVYVTAAFLAVVAIHGGAVSFHTMSALAIVLVLYFFLPLLSRIQIWVPVFFSIAFAVLIDFRLPHSEESILISILILVLANLLGLQFARMNHRSQRMEYWSLQTQEALAQQLRDEIIRRERIDRRLRENEENFRQLFEAAPVPMVLTELDTGRTLQANQLAREAFGTGNRPLSEFYTPDFYLRPEDRARTVRKIMEQGRVSGLDIELKTAQEEPLEALLAASRVNYQGQPAILAGFMDISTQKRAVRQFKRLAGSDGLTGIPNRRAFFNEAEKCLEKRFQTDEPNSVLLLDADNFKRINDLHGHAAGDEVLRGIARIMRNMLIRGCVFGRIGGEEFAVFLPGQGDVQAQQTAEALRQRIAELEFDPDSNRNTTLRVTVSVGVTIIKPDGETLDKALARADQALYIAKRNGRNRVEVIAST